MGLNTTKEPAAVRSGPLGNCDQAAKQINARVNITPIHDRQTHSILEELSFEAIEELAPIGIAACQDLALAASVGDTAAIGTSLLQLAFIIESLRGHFSSLVDVELAA